MSFFCFLRLCFSFCLLVVLIWHLPLPTGADDKLVKVSIDAFGLNTSPNADQSHEVEESESNDGSGAELHLQTSKNKTQLFPPNHTAHLTPLDITLEQFIDTDFENTETAGNLTELILEFQLYKHINLTSDELLDQYDEAMENLLKIAPKLRVLHSIGGHFYFPDNDTRDQLEFELRFVRDGLDTLTSLMQKHNLSLADDQFNYIKYTLYLVFDKQAINDTMYYQLLKQIFGQTPMQLVNQNLPAHFVSLLFDLNDVNIKLDILKFEDPKAVANKGLKQNTRLNYNMVIEPLFELEQEKVATKVKEPLKLLS